MQWTSDSLLWSKSKYKEQDQEWLLQLTRNSCTTNLKVKVEEKFEKLEGHHEGETTYLWLMLHTVIYITDEVATSLKTKIKEFKTGGLKSYAGENIKTAKTELVAICTRLAERNMLPDDAVDDTISGLGVCSHPDFFNIFLQMATARKNKLLKLVTITGTPIEQIKQVWGEADSHYTSLHLAEKWNVPGSSAHYGEGRPIPQWLKCDNCGKKSSPQELHQATGSSQDQGSEKGEGRSQGSKGKGGGSYTRTSFGQGKWGPPKNGQIVRKIDGKVYCACKECGWTTGSNAHSTGKYDEWKMNPSGFTLHDNHPYNKKLRELEISVDTAKKSNNSSEKSTAGGNVGLSMMVKQAQEFEKATEDPETAAFAGQFAAMLLAMSKMSPKE